MISIHHGRYALFPLSKTMDICIIVEHVLHPQIICMMEHNVLEITVDMTE